tara:strand:+ start:10922 stop:12676 length:1755 start_codon:yes stop_codon:yes gene_type:complete
MLIEKDLLVTLESILKTIYPHHSSEKIAQVVSRLMQIINEYSDKGGLDKGASNQIWDSSSTVLITYPDAIYKRGEPTLTTLSDLIDQKIGNIAKIIHILPFLKSTSDGGFSVSSHKDIEPIFGSWNDLKNFSDKHLLMADLVLNHVSASHPWVHEFMQSQVPGCDYILAPEEKEGWENVVRPRNSSLFISLETKNGKRNTWTTFGPDQIDLNWKNPNILIEFLELIILYLKNGVRWIRLDAVAFIWKEKETNCLHRFEVHQIVKLLRVLLEKLVGNSVLITETNVPELENLSYLSSGDEAHVAYNFPLPPLLLECLLTNKSDLLNRWLSSWPDFPEKTSYLNFTASHDGIGLRALEGLMDQERFHQLLVSCEKRGGLISHRRMQNGEDSPYELNISWWSAMSDGGVDPSCFQLQRFLLSQVFVLALKGIPAFYLPAILASENDLRTFGRTGQRRDLNREKFEAESIFNELADKRSLASQILNYLNSAIDIRSKEEAFHPESPMKCLTKSRSDLIIIRRGSDSDQRIWAIHNMTNMRLTFHLTDNILMERQSADYHWKDCLKNELITDNKLEFDPYSVKWLKISN